MRTAFRKVFEKHSVQLTIGVGEKRINEETFDVQLVGKSRTILVPGKTRETMGGGHANLFTRDIFKAISVAHEYGYECLPVIIAESWGGDLTSLRCENLIYLRANPNQIDAIEPMLELEVEKLIPFLKRFA